MNRNQFKSRIKKFEGKPKEFENDAIKNKTIVVNEKPHESNTKIQKNLDDFKYFSIYER